MVDNRGDAPAIRFSLWQLLIAIFWLAAVLGLARIYPAAPAHYLPHFGRTIVAQSAVMIGCFAASGGFIGVVSGRGSARCLWFGAAIGLPIAVVCGIYRFMWEILAANSV